MDINLDQAIFEKKDESTVKITLPPPSFEFKIDDMLAQKADLESKVLDTKTKKENAVNNWDGEIAGYELEIEKLNKVIIECTKLEVKSEQVLEIERQQKGEDIEVPIVEEKISFSLNEDSEVPKEEVI